MLQLNSMKYKIYMFLSFIIYVILFEKYFKGILVNFFFEPTTHLTMQLHRNSENSITQFRIKK